MIAGLPGGQQVEDEGLNVFPGGELVALEVPGHHLVDVLRITGSQHRGQRTSFRRMVGTLYPANEMVRKDK